MLLGIDDKFIGKPYIISGDEERLKATQEHMRMWEIEVEHMPAVMLKTAPATEKHFSHVSVGVNLSHAAVLRKLLIEKDERPFVMVFEDDCRFFSEPREKIVAALTKLMEVDPDFAVLSLGCYYYERQGKAPPLNDGFTMGNNVAGWHPWGAHAWIYNRRRSIEIISWLSGLWNPVDHLIFHPDWREKCWLMRPSLAYQEGFERYADVIGRCDEGKDKENG